MQLIMRVTCTVHHTIRPLTSDEDDAIIATIALTSSLINTRLTTNAAINNTLRPQHRTISCCCCCCCCRSLSSPHLSLSLSLSAFSCVFHFSSLSRRNYVVYLNVTTQRYYYRFSQHRDHLQWRLVLGYYS